MAILTIQDANGKDFKIDPDAIMSFTGDLKDSEGGGHRTNQLKSLVKIKYVGADGKDLDPISVISDMENDPGSIMAIDVDVEATHSGENHNYVTYYEDSMEKDAETFMNPFPKPILKNHNSYSGEPLGRVTAFATGPSNITDDRSAIFLKARITDKEAIPKFLDGRYSTVSIAGTMNTVTCNICGKTILKDRKFKFCGHWRGETYKDKVCYWGARDICYSECSVVNTPADDFAQITKVTVIKRGDSTEKVKEKENMSKPSDAKKAKLLELLDSFLDESGDAGGQTGAAAAAGTDSQTGTDDSQAQAANAKDAEIVALKASVVEKDAKIAALETELADAKAAKEAAEEAKKGAEAAKDQVSSELETAKAQLYDMAVNTKETIVDFILLKEKTPTAAEDARRKELMGKSMKELNDYMGQEAPQQGGARQQGTATNPTLASDSKGNNSDRGTAADPAAKKDPMKQTKEILDAIIESL